MSQAMPCVEKRQSSTLRVPGEGHHRYHRSISMAVLRNIYKSLLTT